MHSHDDLHDDFWSDTDTDIDSELPLVASAEMLSNESTFPMTSTEKTVRTKTVRLYDIVILATEIGDATVTFL